MILVDFWWLFLTWIRIRLTKIKNIQNTENKVFKKSVTDIHTDIQTDIQTDTHTDRHTDRQTDRQIHRGALLLKINFFPPFPSIACTWSISLDLLPDTQRIEWIYSYIYLYSFPWPWDSHHLLLNSVIFNSTPPPWMCISLMRIRILDRPDPWCGSGSGLKSRK